jgi:hypothetical protein
MVLLPRKIALAQLLLGVLLQSVSCLKASMQHIVRGYWTAKLLPLVAQLQTVLHA